MADTVLVENARVLALDLAGQCQQRIALAGQQLHLVVDFDHEFMEVNATFAAIRQAVIKTIHQERFAAPHPAPDVQAFRHVRTEQAAAEELVAFGLEFDQLLPERFQLFNRRNLPGVANKTGFLASRLIPGLRADASVCCGLQRHATASINSSAF